MRTPSLNPPLKRDSKGFAFVYHATIPNASRRKIMGKWGTDEAAERYRQFLEQLRSQQEVVSEEAPPLIAGGMRTIRDLYECWELSAVRRHTRNGVVSDDLENMRSSIRELLACYGDDYAITFGPKKLGVVRDVMAASGRFARGTINSHLGRIRRFFKWAAGEELFSAEKFHALKTVAGVSQGATGVRDNGPVLPADLSSFDAVLPYCPPVVADMMRVQFICVMRPQDVCQMHEGGLDRQSDIWLYTPDHHKTAWRGKTLTKAVPKAAQELLEPRLGSVSGYLFDPNEARAWGRQQAAATRGERKTKRYPCEERRLADSKSMHVSSAHYSVGGYRTAIKRAFDRAEAGGLDLARFTPNQIRHAAVTWTDDNLAEKDAPQKLAGHDHATTTDRYKNRTRQRLVELGRAIDEAFQAE